MAIVKLNNMIDGVSGMVGDYVFKQVRGKTVMCSRPPKPVTQSHQQKENRDRFRKASQWAKEVLSDPDQKAYYQKKARKLDLPNAYTAAIADYMRSTVVKQVNRYADKTTFAIFKKDFDVAQVDIIVNKDSGEKEKRTLPKGEFFFWLHPAEVNAGVVVRLTDAAGVIRRHALMAA